MEYNKKFIGSRIKAERKKRNWSQSHLIDLLSEKEVYIGRNTLSQIENGTHDFNNFSLGLLTKLCEKDFFDCEIGYLLGEYSCRTGRNTDIKKETGLSNESIDTLKFLNNYWRKDLLKLLDHILKDSYTFIDFIENLSLYVDNEYTTPIYHDEENNKFIDCSYHTPNGNGILFGNLAPDNDGNPRGKMKGVSTSILESHAMLQMLDIINKWKREYKGE